MTSAPALDCVLVMPAYNEEGCIASVIQAWTAELARHCNDRFRLIVVNDGSRDRTGAILDEEAARNPRLRVIHQPNSGHGGALLHGYREAIKEDAAYVFQVDSDDQFVPEDFVRLWNLRTSSPCVLGNRSVRHDSFHRLVITRILRVVLWGLYGRRLRDANIPFRLFERRFLAAALRLIPANTFAPNIFLAVIAARAGANLHDTPVTHRDRRTGTVSIVRWKLIKVCFRCVGELLAFRRILAEGLPSVMAALPPAPSWNPPAS